ncbi:MAG: peptidylprolyl isomerase, partial [Ramlibacter sp.]
MKFSVLLCRGVAASLFVLAPLAASAADPVLAEAGKVAIHATDIQGDALRIPVERRKPTLAVSDNVKQLASNLVIRRALAGEAEAAGLANDPAVQAAVRIARDRVLSDALIARIDAANKPDPKVMADLALATYKSNPKRFEMPAETGARHILIKLDTPDAKAKAEKILAELKAGADFDKLASEQSQDPGSAPKGGELGYFPAGRMVPAFEEAVSKLQKPGELSDVVETQFGYHIIKLEGRRSAGIRPFEQVKDDLQRELEIKYVNDKRLAEVQRIRDTV